MKAYFRPIQDGFNWSFLCLPLTNVKFYSDGLIGTDGIGTQGATRVKDVGRTRLLQYSAQETSGEVKHGDGGAPNPQPGATLTNPLAGPVVVALCVVGPKLLLFSNDPVPSGLMVKIDGWNLPVLYSRALITKGDASSPTCNPSVRSAVARIEKEMREKSPGDGLTPVPR